MAMPDPLNGILNVDKPPGISSARVVGQVKQLLPRGVKIGHAGTLDPFATGVLLLLVGKATKSCERVMDAPKQYEASIRLGATTATDDPESPPHPWQLPNGAATRPVRQAEIEAVLPRFIGDILQRPPAFSALKVGGRRAYDLARKGADVQLTPRRVRVYEIQLLDYLWPDLRLRIDCGRGTYIRAIARDLGQQLDVGAYLTQLRRTVVGSFLAAQAVSVEELARTGLTAHLKPIPDVAPSAPATRPACK